MDYAWFLYTIALMVIAVMAGSTSVTVWVLTNRKDCLVAATGFLAYALDVGTILFDEYIREKPVLEEYFSSGLTHPVFNIVLRVTIVTCIWLWIARRVHAKVERRHVIIFAAAYAVLAVLVAPIGQYAGTLRTMLFWDGSAYAMGVEDRLGTLAVGKQADICVLDRNLFTCAPAEVLEMKSVLTLIGGKVVYEA